MRISPRFAPIVFGALLSAIMTGIVSAFVLTFSQGLHPGFFAQWLKSCALTWPIAFPTVTASPKPTPRIGSSLALRGSPASRASVRS